MEKSIALESLPKLFHDFITVAAALGARYVWIDALCIIQDDFQDWVKEAATMNLVYGNSYLTIAATAAPDPTHSLFPGRFRHGISAVGDRLSESAFLDAGILHHCKENPKWFTRGWTFQEYLLSPRVLHFEESELVWHCNENQRCECGNVEGTRSIREAQMIQLRETFKLAVRGVTGNEHWDLTAQNYDEWNAARIAAWHTCAVRYSERALSNRADHAVAISGIAEAFTKAGLDEYYAGSWSASFSEDLCWLPRWDSGIQKAPDPWNGKLSEYLAPSWSWLATGRPVRFYPEVRVLEKHVTLEPCEIKTESSRTWAKVIGGYANVNALGVKIQLTVDSKRRLYIHPEYLDRYADILAYEAEGEPCGALDDDPTIQQEKEGISSISSCCLLATTHMPEEGPLRIGTLILLEEVGPNLTTTGPFTYDDPYTRIPPIPEYESTGASPSMGRPLKLRLQGKINFPKGPKMNPPKFYPPMEHRRIGILRVRMDYQRMASLHPHRDWKII